MPAQNDPITGAKILVKAGNQVVGGQQDGTINFSPNSTSVNSKTDYGWSSSMYGLFGWGVDVSGMWYEGATDPDASDGFGASLGLRDPGGTTYTQTNGLSSLTINLELATYERANQDYGGWVVQAPDLRSATLNVEVDYIDPNATDGGAVDKVFAAALENRTDLEFQASFGDEGSTFTGTAKPMPNSLSFPTGDDSTLSFDLESQGPITNGVANADPGLTALLNAFFADPVTALLVEAGAIMDGTQSFTGDYTKFSGQALPSTISITIPASGPIETSGSLAGTSALTREVVSVPA